MTYELPDKRPLSPLRRPNLWAERLLLIAFLLCLVVGIAALAVLWSIRDTDQPSLADDPLRAVRSDLILPQLALRQLAGDPAAGLAVQAMQAGQLETARAILTYDVTISPSERVGRLAKLARLYLEADQPLAAAQTYRLVMPGAILNAALPSLERTQLLTQAAKGLVAAKQDMPALDAVVQAQRVGSQSPDLLPAQRSQVFHDLRPIADSLADLDVQRQIDDLARNPFLTAPGVLITPTLSTLSQPLPYDDATQAAIGVRQEAARLLADRINLTGGVDIDPEKQGLAQALIAEDQARRQFYQNTLAGDLSLEQQTGLLLDRLTWLATKARVALGGYGISLLPEWETQADTILNELGALYGNLNQVYEAHAGAQTTPQAQAMLRAEAQQWLAEQIERGLYVTLPARDLAERIRISQEELARQGLPPALPLAYETDSALPGFRIQQK